MREQAQVGRPASRGRHVPVEHFDVAVCVAAGRWQKANPWFAFAGKTQDEIVQQVVSGFPTEPASAHRDNMAILI
jgi:hypothetical protein